MEHRYSDTHAYHWKNACPRFREPVESLKNGHAVDTGISESQAPYVIFASLIRKTPYPLHLVEKLLLLFLNLGIYFFVHLSDGEISS